MKNMNREKWLKGIKLTAAAVCAIVAANLLGLKFSATAGIITILSIQNTKKETMRVACRRGLAFLCALCLAAVSFGILGFTIAGFAFYLLCFSCICLCFGWTEAIAMDSVLITHFLTEGNMNAGLLTNEFGLFLLGTGMGILANLHLHKKTELFDQLAERADRKMRDALNCLRRRMMVRDEKEQNLTNETIRNLKELESELVLLKDCAYQNWNNTFFRISVYEVEYARMRERQAEVLRHIQASVEMAQSMPRQAERIAGLIGKIEAEYDRDNTVETLLEELQQVFEKMRQEPLPEKREEFEARAVLFYLLKQLEEFLELKRNFVKGMESGWGTAGE